MKFFRAAFLAFTVVFAGFAGALLGNCGPFTDVAADAFCPFVLEIFYLGITTGTTATTYDPTANVTRLQMAAFLSRTVDGVLKRGSRRAALDQFWTSQNSTVLGITTVAVNPTLLQSDGSDIWVACENGARVARVRSSDGKLLETWTASQAFGVVIAMGRVFVSSNAGVLYSIDPSQPAGSATTVASLLPANGDGIAFDGTRIWIANFGPPASVSIVTPGPSIPWTVTTVTTGFSHPFGAVYDGANVWVTDATAAKLLKLDAAGAILQSVTVGANPEFPVFDGTNIWVPNNDVDSVSVVRPGSGSVLQTLTGNGLNGPTAAAFDGQRVLVTSEAGAVSLWKAADLTAIGSVSTPASTNPYGACSDGVNFWIAYSGSNTIARF